MATTRTIIVAGAGIGGLTAALALAAQGFRIVVLEKAERVEEIGAGLQLSPNASRILTALGLHEAIAARALAPDAVSLMSARAGGEIARLPLGEAAALRAGAPYWVMHRADLQSVLLAAVRATPDIELRLGHQFEDAAPHANGVTVSARHDVDREHVNGLALIGADGVWSAVRHRMFPNVQPRFSGLIAWRGTIDARRLPREMAPTRVQIWMGPNAHIVVYPIASGRRINVVAITRGDWNRPGWTAAADAADIHALLSAGWPMAARTTLDAVDQLTRYALFTMPDGGLWNDGPMTLLGDAAHAMLPFAAQGAGMAIEDAAVLAKCIGPFNAATTPTSVAASLATYAGQRRGRVARVQRAARQSGAIYHLRGPLALARDLAIRALGGQRLLARQDWIYDWRS
ncbi:MAG: monooxygenase [Tardiphaga sp.]|nr:monooxygenase [Tardiphaga sp.]